jgi:Ran GTPase-activating protein (RanGAP) involved in mRNA processing and transport
LSSNTNTLFWVITGAVIVLAVFLLINNSQSDTLARISDKFSSIIKDQGIVKFDIETSEENESNNQDEEEEEELP